MQSTTSRIRPLAAAPVLFIEDIFVLPEERGKGAGKAHHDRPRARRRPKRLRANGVDRPRLEQAPAIKFYRRLGARPDKTWVLTRLTGANLRRLARA